MTKDQTQDTPNARDGDSLSAARLADLPGASFAMIETPEMIDRIVAMGVEARGLEIVTIELPDDVHGLPRKVSALVKHGANGITFERLRPLFEDFKTAPERKTGTAKVTTLESFVDLVNRHKDGDSAVFAQTLWPTPKLTAVLDYHRARGAGPMAGDARFGQHRVEYLFPLTEEFKAWMTMDGKAMEQREFAIFLEDHVDELAAPYEAEKSDYERLFKERVASPIELVDLSRNLEIHVGQKIKRAERISSGERTIVFESQHMTATGEAVEIPGVFMISVRAFIDGDPVRIPARLRYRTKAGEITWLYQLYRPEFWLRTRVQEDLLDAATRTALPTFEGAPE